MSSVVIAGSRDGVRVQDVMAAIVGSGFSITELINGKAPRGADRIALDWANEYLIPVKPFPADWFTFSNGAGMVRNAEMATYAKFKSGKVIAVWDFKSSGTANMIANAIAQRLPLYVFDIRNKTGKHVDVDDGYVRGWATRVLAYGFKNRNKHAAR